MMRSSALLVMMAMALPVHAADLALVGGTVLTANGAPIAGGTVLVRGEKIALVGKDVAIPAGAEVIRCEGKWVTPGLIESHSAIGAVEILAFPETVDIAANRPEPIRAALRMDDAINLWSSLVGVARRQGVTSVVVAPIGGVISGRSAWLDLLPPASPLAKTAVVSPVAMHATIGDSGAAVMGMSRPMLMEQLREVFEDTRLFQREGPAFQRNALRKLTTSRLDLAALIPVLDRKLPLVIEAHRAADLLQALKLAREERLEIVLLGAEEGWLVRAELAQAKVAVIIDPLANLPGKFEVLNARQDNAALLAQAGVRVVLTTESAHNAGTLRFVAGNAVRAGLSPDLALRAITRIPAEIFGQGQRLGTIEAGRQATLVVWTGDPFETSSWPEVVLVRGERISLESRQTKLRDRYKAKLGL